MERFKKFILPVVVFLAIGGFGYAKYSGYLGSISAETQKASGTVGSIVRSVSNTTVTITDPPAPIGGKIMAVVELGASGYNAFVANIDMQGRYRVTSRKFGSSLAIEGNTSLDEVKSQLRTYLSDLSNKVAGKNLHFVISSGALKEPKIVNAAKGLESLGYVVNRISADQEGKFAFRAAIHPEYVDKAFVVDIGSGNTKITWQVNGSLRSVETAGAKYFQKGLSDQTVYDEVKNAVNQIPAELRGTVFLVGGGPNDLAVITGKKSTYTTLNDLNSYQVGDNQKLACTTNILKAIQENTGASLVFNDNAFFPIGFLMSLR